MLKSQKEILVEELKRYADGLVEKIETEIKNANMIDDWFEREREILNLGENLYRASKIVEYVEKIEIVKDHKIYGRLISSVCQRFPYTFEKDVEIIKHYANCFFFDKYRELNEEDLKPKYYTGEELKASMEELADEIRNSY